MKKEINLKELLEAMHEMPKEGKSILHQVSLCAFYAKNVEEIERVSFSPELKWGQQVFEKHAEFIEKRDSHARKGAKQICSLGTKTGRKFLFKRYNLRNIEDCLELSSLVFNSLEFESKNIQD